jgi:hypothetical protein
MVLDRHVDPLIHDGLPDANATMSYPLVAKGGGNFLAATGISTLEVPKLNWVLCKTWFSTWFSPWIHIALFVDQIITVVPSSNLTWKFKAALWRTVDYSRSINISVLKGNGHAFSNFPLFLKLGYRYPHFSETPMSSIFLMSTSYISYVPWFLICYQ